MKKKTRPMIISLRKIALYRNRSETPMMDFMKTVRTMERIANLEDENKRLKSENQMLANRRLP